MSELYADGGCRIGAELTVGKRAQAFSEKCDDVFFVGGVFLGAGSKVFEDCMRDVSKDGAGHFTRFVFDGTQLLDVFQVEAIRAVEITGETGGADRLERWAVESRFGNLEAKDRFGSRVGLSRCGRVDWDRAQVVTIKVGLPAQADFLVG